MCAELLISFSKGFVTPQRVSIGREGIEHCEASQSYREHEFLLVLLSKTAGEGEKDDKKQGSTKKRMKTGAVLLRFQRASFAFESLLIRTTRWRACPSQ